MCKGSGVVRDYKVTKLPQIFIVDREGVIQVNDLFMKTEEIKAAIDPLLAP
jgi:hypothetical protein